MPYIKQSRREELQEAFEALKGAKVSAKGDLNYLLFRLCKETVTPSYNGYKEFIGELECCAAEIYRRLAAPYEDQKILENGDI